MKLLALMFLINFSASLFAWSLENDSLKKVAPSNYFCKEKGYGNMTELAIISGLYYQFSPTAAQQPDVGLSIQTVNGFRFCPYFFMGGGIGIDRFITYHETFSPFFLRLYSEFLKRRVTPYIYVDAGYSLLWKQPVTNESYFTTFTPNSGGAYTAGSLGIRIRNNSRVSALIGLGYMLNNTGIHIFSWATPPFGFGGSDNLRINYLHLVFSSGISF